MTALSVIRVQIRKPTGLGGPDGTQVDQLPDTEVDRYANESYRNLLDRFAFREKEIVATLYTVAGTRNYTMPDPHDGLRQIDIMHPDSLQHSRLDAMSVDDYTQRWNETESAQAYPTHYVRESCLFRLYPTPDEIYKLTVRYWGILADLESDDQTIAIPNVWLPPIRYGAVALIFADIGDLSRAEAFFNLQSKLIGDIVPIQTKEEEDYHRAGVEVLGREY